MRIGETPRMMMPCCLCCRLACSASELLTPVCTIRRVDRMIIRKLASSEGVVSTWEFSNLLLHFDEFFESWLFRNGQQLKK